MVVTGLRVDTDTVPFHSAELPTNSRRDEDSPSPAGLSLLSGPVLLFPKVLFSPTHTLLNPLKQTAI